MIGVIVMILMKIEDVAKQIGLSPSTVKKYYLLVEKYGYRFRRNNQGQLTFTDSDIQLFNEIILVKNEPGITVQRAVEIVMSSITDITVQGNTNITDMTEIKVISAITEQFNEIRSLVVSQNQTIIDQQEEIKNLIKNQEENRRLIEEREIKERDALLMKSIQETRELKEQISKPWWKKIF